MIAYDLRCDQGHRFEVWFRNAAAYDDQHERGLLTCPHCGSTTVDKAPMAPNLARHHGARTSEPAAEPAARDSTPAAGVKTALPATSSSAPEPPTPASPDPERVARMFQMLEAVRQHVERHTDDVGKDFAEEARRIHYGETEDRGIRGEASDDEAKALREEGIDIHRLPSIKRRNDA